MRFGHCGTSNSFFQQASTVSATDCDIRRGNWRSQQDDPLPITPGVDIAGKVYGVSQKVTSQFNLFPGQTVVSLVKWGGNSRFVSLSPEQLVRVPDGIDPAQATCLAETYLSAFQMLHHGQKGSRRYVEKSLSGKSVLIVGLMTNSFGKAIMELALNAGAAIVFATAKKKHWKMLIELGIIPLGLDPSEWVERVQGTVDLVLAPMGELVGEDLTAVYHRTLRDTGHLIMYGRRHSGDDISVGHRAHKQPSLVCKPIKASLNLKDRTHSYDVYEQWDQNLEICKKDLMHLLGMLERGIIKPRVLDRIPLSKVAQAQRLIESRRRISGFLVCEPWMKKKKRALYL
jgi:NADPH:quinone reductase-like Zn-dependent oxidoreductase